MHIDSEKITRSKLKVFEKLLFMGYNTDKKMLDMKIEDLLLSTCFTRSELNIAVGIKQSLTQKSLISYLCGADMKI